MTQESILQNMINVNNTTDQTELIRALKHSELLRIDINTLIDLKVNYIDRDESELHLEAMVKCNFLYTYYNDMYNRIRKDEIDLNILYQLLDALKEIEDEKTDQHEASYKVGILLKKIYIDSALKKADKLNKNIGYMIPESYDIDVNKDHLFWKCQVKIPIVEYNDFESEIKKLNINNEKNMIYNSIKNY